MLVIAWQAEAIFSVSGILHVFSLSRVTGTLLQNSPNNTGKVSRIWFTLSIKIRKEPHLFFIMLILDKELVMIKEFVLRKCVQLMAVIDHVYHQTAHFSMECFPILSNVFFHWAIYFCFSSIAIPYESDEFEVAEKITKRCKSLTLY